MEPWTLEEIGERLAEVTGGSRDDTAPKAALRLRILEIASDHFVRFGYRRANIGEIAADAGIGKGSLYLHFDSKKTLLIACFAYEKLALVPEIEAILKLDPSERLQRYLEVVFRFALDAPLTSAYLRGDREFVAAVSGYLSSHEEDRERSRAFLASLIDPRLGLSRPRRDTLAGVLGTLAALTAHLPDHATHLGVRPGEVATELAALVARGVAYENAK